MSQCPNCGTQASGKFCPNCGAQIPDQTAAAAMPSPPQPQQYVQQPQPPMPPQQGYPPQYQPQPGYPPQPGYQMPPKKKGIGAFGWIGIVMGVIAVIIVALVAIGGSAPVQTPVITTAWQEGAKLPSSATTVSADSKIIYAVVETNMKQPTAVTAKWYLDGEHATDLDTTETPQADKPILAFHLTAEKGFPTGQYKVEIWVGGNKETEQTFTVK